MARRRKYREDWAEQVLSGYQRGRIAPTKTPKGIVRFEWLKTFGALFKRDKKKGETFTEYMKRLNLWK